MSQKHLNQTRKKKFKIPKDTKAEEPLSKDTFFLYIYVKESSDFEQSFHFGLFTTSTGHFALVIQ